MVPLHKKQATYATGKHAEFLAAQHLLNQGYEVIEQRYKTAYGEIDIIAQMGNLLVFVEVKARTDEARALESLGLRQIKRIITAAEHYLSQLPTQHYDIRFDLITVSEAGITHLQHAFEKTWE